MVVEFMERRKGMKIEYENFMLISMTFDLQKTKSIQWFIQNFFITIEVTNVVQG